MFLAHCMESQRPLDPLVWVNPSIRVLTFLREDCGYSPRKSYKKLFEDLGKPHVLIELSLIPQAVPYLSNPSPIPGQIFSKVGGPSVIAPGLEAYTEWKALYLA